MQRDKTCRWLLSPSLEEHVIDAVDHDRLADDRSNTGRWTAAWFIISVEVAARFTYYGIASNLISYLTGPLDQSTAVAAANVNAWSGISSILPVLGAFVAYAFLGRYRTIIIASLIYILLRPLADVITVVGMQEFFYSQVPTELRSIGLALYLSALGVGSLLSSLLVSVIDFVTGGDAGNSWFKSNLNRDHLDYFYWLLAVISFVGLSVFLFVSKSYIYRRVDGV